MRSIDEGDADQKAEKPERTRESSGGTVRITGEQRQASTARGEKAGMGEGALLEEVLRRENV